MGQIAGIPERIDYKGCPQGLHVMAEELEWMEVAFVHYERLKRAANVELRRANPRSKRVAEGICWFAERQVPVGWSLYHDQRTLPCFYREYPPASSWRTPISPEIFCLVCKRILSDHVQLAVVHAKTCADGMRRQAPNQHGRWTLFIEEGSG